MIFSRALQLSLMRRYEEEVERGHQHLADLISDVVDLIGRIIEEEESLLYERRLKRNRCPEGGNEADYD